MNDSQAYPPAPRVSQVLCASDLPDGHTISAAQFVDGRLAVFLDNNLTHARVWPSDQLHECIKNYLKQKWDLQHPALRPPAVLT